MIQDEARDYFKENRILDNSRSHLCLMCGRCCRMAAQGHSYEELLKLKADGDIEATEFLSCFAPYETLEKAKEVDPVHFERVMNELKSKPDFDESKVSLYHCSYISKDNLCSNYEKRPDCCRRAPNSAWALFPPGCGYEGWQFEQREKQKKHVRQMKELLYELSFYPEDHIITSDNQSVKELKEKISKEIEPWKKYGADEW